MAKWESTTLYEKTPDIRQKPLITSHSLPDLFEPLKPFFPPEIEEVLEYFSNPFEEGEEFREFAAKALVASESLLTFSREYNTEFALPKILPSTPVALQMPAEIEQLKTLLQKVLSHFTKKAKLTFFIQKLNDREENYFDKQQRQTFFFNCLEEIERGIQRLESAYKEVSDETSLAYNGEVLHVSCLLLERSLLALISYHAVNGENGKHKIFQSVSSGAQVRAFKYVHHLKTLSDTLKTHLAENLSANPLFTEEMDQVIKSLQTYNMKTHRYLSSDESPLGVSLKKLHNEIILGTGNRSHFNTFRDTHTHPLLSSAVKTTIKLIKALPLI